jgi:SagB-type dehydrogenase family enzyme
MKTVIASSLDYHRNTEYHRNTLGGHSLDWTNQPDVYKVYKAIHPIPLVKSDPANQQDLWQILKNRESSIPPDINLRTLSDILYLTNTLTAKVRHPGQDFFYRSVASAGALYPNEIYLANNDIRGLDPGLYHYEIRNTALHHLRRQKVIKPVMDALGFQQETDAMASFLVTGIFFRSSWKYRARAYRYVLLDAGHLLENLFLALQYVSLRFSVHYNFHDRKINHILGVNGRQEACIACINIYGDQFPDQEQMPDELPSLSEEIIQSSKVSEREIVYSEIQDIHDAGMNSPGIGKNDASFENNLGITVQSWQETGGNKNRTKGPEYPDLLFRRRSKRNFVSRKMKRDDFLGLLDLVCTSYTPGGTKHDYSSGLQIGMLVSRVDEIAPGFYLINPYDRKFGLVKTGQITDAMTDSCLNQEWLANAAVHFLFMTNLRFFDQHWGPRGYRYTMATAGRLGQMIYLGATAMNMGCCGIGAFYDDEARALLGLNNDSALLYLVAAGPVKRL